LSPLKSASTIKRSTALTGSNSAERPDDSASRFTQASTAARRRIIMSVMGLEKEGKTHFGLTAPGPIGVINLDFGLEGVVQKFQTEKDVFVSHYRVNIPRKGAGIELVSQLATEVWDDIVEDFHYSIANYRTTLCDTGTEMWEVLRMARFGKLDQVKPHHYGPVNAEFRDLYRAAYDGDSNLILLHKMKPEYVNDKTTGKYQRSGFSDTGFQVQIELRAFKVPMDERDEADDIGFRIEVVSCRQNPEIEGDVYQGQLATFPYIAAMVFPDTDPSDWGA
jgi:hypothetical protein